MNNIDWQLLILESITVLGFVEWIKGFVFKTGKEINGNILRLIQLALCFCFAWAFSYLPEFVKIALTVLSITTIGKNKIFEAIDASIASKAAIFTTKKEETKK